MKTIKNAQGIIRVSDEEAKNLTDNKTYTYAKKEEWKKVVRDKDKPIITKTVNKILDKTIKNASEIKGKANHITSKQAEKVFSEPSIMPISDEAKKILEKTSQPKSVRKIRKEKKT